MVNVVVLIAVAPKIAVLDGSLKRMNLYSELPVNSKTLFASWDNL